MEDQIKIGLVQGEDSVRLARRIVGTVSLKGSDGVFELTRRNAEAITRTAVNYYSNAVRETWLADNSDLFTEELFVATLDSRTTPQCRSLDGKTFPIGKGPIPPLHFSCRSLRVASINGEAIGNRPAKPFTEKMFAKEFSNGEFSSRDALPRGMKDAYDSYARKRIREMTEIIPAKVTYQQWLGRQSVAFQDDVLGPTRGKLFRGGKVKLDKFVDRTGKTIPLAKLAKTDAAAFRAAGLDTGDYL
jgi:SPP1 gp7 family putative phage head morphogenesis protein